MKPSLNFVMLDRMPIFRQLQLEEALLRADRRNWCLMNVGSPPAIVMGISGQVDRTIDAEKFSRQPIPVIRRFTGGGTVVVDENTLFLTFICDASALDIPPFPQPVMEWTARFYRPLLKPHFFELKENDYVIEDRKWGGNAQAMIKGRWLHHSSLLWDYCPDLMEYLLLPTKMPAYREVRAHQDFLCRLGDYRESRVDFFESCIERIKEDFCVTEIGQWEIEEIADLPHRKVTSYLFY